MRITKFAHSGVRLESEGRALVLDPGVFTQPEAVEGVAAVLVTHEHVDHWTPELLRAAQAPIFTPAAVAATIVEQAPDLAERITTVTPGEEFTPLDGFAVTAVGEQHAVIHADLPGVHNSGYLVRAGGRTLYHPGDALLVPEAPVDVLCGPICAPWMKISEGIDFARAVGAPLTLAIHERVYSDAGLGIAEAHFSRLLGEERRFVRLADGADLT